MPKDDNSNGRSGVAIVTGNPDESGEHSWTTHRMHVVQSIGDLKKDVADIKATQTEILVELREGKVMDRVMWALGATVGGGGVSLLIALLTGAL